MVVEVTASGICVGGPGGSYSRGGGRFTLYAEVAGDTALAGFGDSYNFGKSGKSDLA